MHIAAPRPGHGGNAFLVHGSSPERTNILWVISVLFVMCSSKKRAGMYVSLWCQVSL